MKYTLERVRGAVSRKTLLPILTNVSMRHGWLQSSNGFITVTTPCPGVDLDFCVPAAPFFKAVDVCGPTPSLAVDGGRLTVSKGKTRIRLPLETEDAYPRAEPISSELEVVPDGLCDVLTRVRPFVGTDAFRLWSHGVLLQDGFVWATNNVVLVRVPFPGVRPMVWPTPVLDEVLRLGEQPVAMAATDSRVELHYEDGTWLAASLIANQWPDTGRFFEVAQGSEGSTEIGQLGAAVEAVAPFCGESPIVRLTSQGVETPEGHYHACVGMERLPEIAFRLEPFQEVLKVAKAIDFDLAPCRWWAPGGLEGVISPIAQAKPT